jgi:hypothetical protein
MLYPIIYVYDKSDGRFLPVADFYKDKVTVWCSPESYPAPRLSKTPWLSSRRHNQPSYNSEERRPKWFVETVAKSLIGPRFLEFISWESMLMCSSTVTVMNPFPRSYFLTNFETVEGE